MPGELQILSVREVRPQGVPEGSIWFQQTLLDKQAQPLAQDGDFDADRSACLRETTRGVFCHGESRDDHSDRQYSNCADLTD